MAKNVCFASLVLVLALALAQLGHAQVGVKVAPQPAGGKDKKEDANVTHQGQLTDKDPFDPVRQGCRHKVYKHKMIAGKTYEIYMASQAFDTYLRLEDSAGRQLAADDDGGGGLNSKITFTPQKTDTYTIIATSCGSGQTGAFTLSISVQRPVKGLFSVQGRLTQDDPFDVVRQGCRHKVYELKLEANKTYRIFMSSNQMDSFLRLEDFRGNELAQDDDGGGNLNSLIIFRPTETETYRIIATTCGPNQTGDFQLSVTAQ